VYIEQAKLKLYRQAPYWSHLLQVTDVEEVETVPERLLAQYPHLQGVGVYTEARKDHWCVVFVAEVVQHWPESQRVGALAAELMRLVTRAAERKGSRDDAYWTPATDCVVNVALHESGYMLPDEAVFPKDFDLSNGLPIENYYDALQKKFPPPPQGGGGSDSGGGQQGGQGGAGAEGHGQPGNDASGSSEGDAPAPRGQSGGQIGGPPQDGDAQRRQDRAARQFAKNAPRDQGVGSLCQDLPEEEVADQCADWRDILFETIRRTLCEQAGSDFARYGRISPRQGGVGYGEDAPRIPAWYKREYDLAVAIDTSGSMYGDLATLRAEVEGICRAVSSDIRLIQCDAAVCEDKKHKRGAKLELKGGGGTDFGPVFDAVDSSERRPTALVYITDGYGSFPHSAPSYPVIWAAVGGIAEQAFPFGRVVRVGDGKENGE
jgi:hypothetical protein